MLTKNMGRVISRSDIPEEESAKAKIIPEDPATADRVNPVIEE